MMIPDKIYLTVTPYKVLDGWCDTKTPHPEGMEQVEYIRKDALLEWLKLAVECYSHPNPVNVVDAIRCEGKKWGFQDVINKINSEIR